MSDEPHLYIESAEGQFICPDALQPRPEHVARDPFHSPDPLPIPASDQERCGGSRVIAFPGASDVRNPRACPGCPDCKPDSLSDQEGEWWTLRKTDSGYVVAAADDRRIATNLHHRDAERLVEEHNILATRFYMGAPQALLECEEALRVSASLLDAAEKDVERWKACAVRERELASGEAYKAILAKLTEAPPGEAEFKDSHAAVALATATTLCAASEARAESAEHSRDEALAQRDSLREGLERVKKDLEVALHKGSIHARPDIAEKFVRAAKNKATLALSEPRPDSAEGER